MPRIRTIKPEFWADEKVAKLPRDARLLFIGLFNFADDAGRLRGSPLLIRAQVFPYDADVDSESLLRMLAESSLIVRYDVAGESYLWIRHFSRHQKIDRPSDSVLPPPPSDKPQRHSAKARRTIAEGSLLEGKGKEQGTGKGKEDLPPPENAAAPTAAVWDSYSDAFEQRHGARPPDSPKGRSQLKQFLQRVPKDDAPAIAAFYLRHNQALYVSGKHPIDLLLRDAAKIYTEWKTGRMTTSTAARQLDQTQENLQSWAEHMSEEGARALVGK